MYHVDINYQTASGGNTFRATVKASDDLDAISIATAQLRADRRRRIMKIDGGSVIATEG